MNQLKQRLQPSSNSLPAEHVNGQHDASNKQGWKSPWSRHKTMSECLKEERERYFGKPKPAKKKSIENPYSLEKVVIDGVPTQTEESE